MNVTYWLLKLFRTNQFPLVAKLEHLVLQEGTCGYGAFPFNIHFVCILGEGAHWLFILGEKRVK
jgi:hypothetical protein